MSKYTQCNQWDLKGRFTRGCGDAGWRGWDRRQVEREEAYFLNMKRNPLKQNSSFFLFKNLYCYSIRVVCLFSTSLQPTPAELTSDADPHPPPWFCTCVLYSSSCNPLSSLSPPHSPLAIVRLFWTSMSLVIFCLLFSSVHYVPVKGETYGICPSPPG